MMNILHGLGADVVALRKGHYDTERTKPHDSLSGTPAGRGPRGPFS